jgi:hypothetical protein
MSSKDGWCRVCFSVSVSDRSAKVEVYVNLNMYVQGPTEFDVCGSVHLGNIHV